MRTKPYKVALILAVLLVFQASGQLIYNPPFNPGFQYWSGRPTSATNVCTVNATPTDCHIVGVVVASHATTGSITIRDNGTACGGGNCFYADTIAVLANTTYSIPLFGVYCKGGCTVLTTGTLDVSTVVTIGYTK
jgi:hypothetical protein